MFNKVLMKVHNSSEYWVEKDGRGCEGMECIGVKGEGRGSEATCGAQRARDRWWS